ncbi:hypothetical protein [Pontibacter pamirensis]|uniref:hypothetical protein n=1 Tax=Pontibacter pamirensis TaxID=2562824 RepID=UPI00138A05FC|nr:hypothetical protein [Pontibacter pamirensis]
MKLARFIILFITTFLFQQNLMAETWDEPWQKEILKKADYFVLAKVLAKGDTPEAEIEVVKSFGDKSLKGKVKIAGFYMLNMRSASGHGLHLPLKAGATYYLLLKKGEKGNYSLPTPTSGYAFLDSGNVHATYRHSYHQALVPQEVYENTYSQIWSYFRTGKYENSKIADFIKANLAKAPAGFEEQEIATFFLQHVAMETAYLLDKEIPLQTVRKFIETEHFHSRVSALRLLSNTISAEVAKYLYNFIMEDGNDNFEKVTAIQSLWKVGGTEYRNKLLAIQEELSDEETGFGGNIMDPRVATHFPSPRGAVAELNKR